MIKRIIKKIIYLKQLVDSNYGVYYGWEVIYNNKLIVELNFTFTRCRKMHLYELKILNNEFLYDTSVKEIIESGAIFRNKYFKSIQLVPEVDFYLTYYPNFNLIGAEYLFIDFKKDIRYNKFYEIIFGLLFFYQELKGHKIIEQNEHCDEM
jgi:hypothetical protein